MADAKHTKWFPQTERPTRSGVYQREMDYCRNGVGYAEWDGQYWYPCYDSAHAADKSSSHRMPSGYQCEDGEIRWRGLSKATGSAS